MADGLHTPLEREPPSLPASPPTKRVKHIEPAPNLSVACEDCTNHRVRRRAVGCDDCSVTGGGRQFTDMEPIEAILDDDTATPTPLSPPIPHHHNHQSTMATTTPPAASVTLPPINFQQQQQQPALQVKLLSDKAQPPTRGSAFAAGYDLYSAQDATVPARGKVVVDTDISIAVPAGTYGRVAPRSGLAAKHSIDVGAGVIDADYRGPLKVLLFNLGEQDFAIKHGDRIAQLIIERIYTPEVAVVQELPDSVRGAGGFGSTGGFGTVLPPGPLDGA